ncbi:MAG: CvpA family protein [Deltaproteobacteria bacterium]|jgi:membrane protein required for colicin V production|nr:CvpA family protein [Deltaproteobacteria bacterium]
MNALDIALVVVLAYFLIRGIFRGLVKELVSFLGIFIAFWVASVYWPNGAEQLKGIVNERPFQAVLSFIVIYLVTYTLIGILSIFVDKIVKLAITPLVSSLFGAIIGLLKGIALVVVILTATTVFIGSNEPFYRDSVAWPYFEPMTAELKSFMPAELGQLMGTRKSQVSGQLGPETAPPERKLPLAAPTDYKSLLAIIENFPNQIQGIWKERLSTLNADSLSSDPAIINGFVHDHPNLFQTPPKWNAPETPKD